MMKIGDKAPDLLGLNEEGREVRLSDYKVKKIALYFYPKDNTSGCTSEALSFRDHLAEFDKANAVILGVSKDSLKSHQKFREQHLLPFDLIIDENAALCNLFDVIKEKSMYGKKYMGIERSTFVIDKEGVLIKEWRKVKVPGHVEEVLKFVQGLQ